MVVSDSELKVRIVSDREAELSRVFDAPRELVFRAMMDPALITQWWGPRRYRTVVGTMDVRVGGRWRFGNIAADGGEHWFRGEYREIVPNERVVQTFEYEPLAGHVSVETMTLEDLGDGRTLMRVLTVFATAEDARAMAGEGPWTPEGLAASDMAQGAAETYDRLAEILAGLKARG